MKNICGIYKIYCDGNDKVYIGSSVNVRKRRNHHLHHLRAGDHPNQHLQHSFNKYGEDSFWFSLVAQCEPKVLLKEEEKQIKEHNSYLEGFNLIETPTTSMLGYKHSEAAKKKMSDARKRAGRVTGSLTPEQVKQMRQKFFDGERVSSLAKEYGIHRKTARHCIYLDTYGDIPCEIEGYEKMLEELKEARKNGKRPRSRGWSHSKEFVDKFTKAVSKPKPSLRRLTSEQVRAIRHRSSQGEPYRVLAADFGVNQNTISRIVRRLSYKEVESEE
jgi:predicted GIY-YIG superfamily endonuclease|tara:strand:- start:202 stop:1020 length:819 start_codon:yes stop_codon:yes gene_type:complete